MYPLVRLMPKNFPCNLYFIEKIVALFFNAVEIIVLFEAVISKFTKYLASELSQKLK